MFLAGLAKFTLIGLTTVVCLSYFLTPYFIQPHDQISKYLFSGPPLTMSVHEPSSGKMLNIENWAKWRLFGLSKFGEWPSSLVLDGYSKMSIMRPKHPLELSYEWRSDYKIVVKPSADNISVKVVAPKSIFYITGIYQHISAELKGAPSGDTLIIQPQFLFGIDGARLFQDRLSFKLMEITTNTGGSDRIVVGICMITIIICISYLASVNNTKKVVKND